MDMKKTSDDFYNGWINLQRKYLKELINKRKGIRTFKSKDEERIVMVQEATDTLMNIFESNDYTMDQELKYSFKYTEKDIQDIYSFFENANESWIFVDHSPVFKKHMKWFDCAMR